MTDASLLTAGTVLMQRMLMVTYILVLTFLRLSPSLNATMTFMTANSVTISTFLSMDLALFLSASYLIMTCDNLITRYTIFYLFSHEISISLMLAQPSFNFCAVHGYAFFSSLPF